MNVIITIPCYYVIISAAFMYNLYFNVTAGCGDSRNYCTVSTVVGVCN